MMQFWTDCPALFSQNRIMLSFTWDFEDNALFLYIKLVVLSDVP